MGKKKLTKKQIAKIVEDVYRIPPAEKAAQILWELGVRDEDMIGMGSLLPDTLCWPVKNALRDKWINLLNNHR